MSLGMDKGETATITSTQRPTLPTEIDGTPVDVHQGQAIFTVYVFNFCTIKSVILIPLT